MMRGPRSLLAASFAACVVLPVAGDIALAADADDVDAARAGLAAIVSDHRPASPSGITAIAGCPAVDVGRLQTALGDNGVPGGPIESWDSEIDWDEMKAFDPDVIGLFCTGGAGGDPDDSDSSLVAGLGVIDAGSEELALEVEQQFGFGALEPEAADVPGGEVMATCLDDYGLSLCAAVWSHDGFVVAVVLSSDELDIPDGSGTAVLEDVLDVVLSTLAAYEPAGGAATTDGSVATGPATSEPPDATGVLDTAPARAGLRARLSAMDQIDELEPLGDCPIAERDAVIDALETSGVDAPMEALLAEQGPSLTNGTTWHAVGLVCSGTYVGVENDESFPEVRISVVVADFGDTETFQAFLGDVHPDIDVAASLPTPTIGGGTIGECADVDRTDQCAEYWEQDGFVVGVQLVDRVFMDRPTSSAVLVDLVPDIVESLAAEPPVSAGTSVTVPAPVIEAARERVAALSDELNAACPFIDRSAIDVALADASIDFVTDDWSAVTSEGADGAVAGLACAGRSGRSEVRVDVLDFGESGAALDIIELVHGCEQIGDTEYCVESWEQDGLTVTASITVVGADVGQPDVGALIDALAPVVLENLARS
jgi:hypothetical protein